MGCPQVGREKWQNAHLFPFLPCEVASNLQNKW